MAVQVEFLKNIPYFSGLGDAELDSVGRLIFEKTAQKGEILFLEGEPAEALYFVASGVVKVFKTSAGGKEQILAIVRPGESINDVAVFDNGPNPASAQAMGSAVLYGIKKSDLETLLRSYPKISLNVTRVLSQRIRHLVSLVEDLSFRHIAARVARILLEYAGDGAAPKPHLTQQEMAAMAGTAREMIGRSLKALEEERVIRLDRHRIVITNRGALEAMVKDS